MKQQPLRELKAAYEARPFEPFDVVVDDGTRLRVDRAEFIGWSKEAGVLVYSAPDDTFEHYDLARLKQVAPAAGRKRKRS